MTCTEEITRPTSCAEVSVPMLRSANATIDFFIFVILDIKAG